MSFIQTCLSLPYGCNVLLTLPEKTKETSFKVFSCPQLLWSESFTLMAAKSLHVQSDFFKKNWTILFSIDMPSQPV